MKKEDEDEESFTDRIYKYARLYGHTYSKAEVVKNYVQGLKPSVRESIEEDVRLMCQNENIL